MRHPLVILRSAALNKQKIVNRLSDNKLLQKATPLTNQVSIIVEDYNNLAKLDNPDINSKST